MIIIIINLIKWSLFCFFFNFYNNIYFIIIKFIALQINICEYKVENILKLSK